MSKYIEAAAYLRAQSSISKRHVSKIEKKAYQAANENEITA